MMKFMRALGVLLMLALVAAACGDDDSSTETTAATSDDSDDGDNGSDDSGSDDSGSDEPMDDSDSDEPMDDEGDEDESFSGDDNSDFCQTAREFDENNPLDDSSPLEGEAFFDAAEDAFGQVIPIAPNDIKGDFEISLDGIREMRAIVEKYDYNFFDEGLATEFDALDTSAMDAAGDRIGQYLEDVCGIEQAFAPDDDPATSGIVPPGIDPDALDDIDPDVAQAIFDSFGIDEETAACLTEEFGGDFDIESAMADPSFLTQPVCGTTLLEIMSGVGQG